jgi:ribosome-associated protein
MVPPAVHADAIALAGGVRVPLSDLRFEFSRSGGPGGQNVNKVSTRVTLRFDVGASGALSAEDKARVRVKLSTRMTRDGVLYVVSSKHRTQNANRRAAVERFAELLAGALHREKARKKTRVSHGARKRRVEEKRRRSALKRLRTSAPDH